MEELKILVDMVAHLPAMALWVIGFFFIYKLSVIASVYGTIRFIAQKLYETVVEKRKPIPAQVVEYRFAGKFIDEECRNAFNAQVIRLVSSQWATIHMDDVKKLAALIDAKLESEKKK